MYPPPLYLPSAAGIVIGRAAGRSVLDTLFISRLLTGLTAVALGALAIALAEGAAIWIFAVLTLPMSLSQIASVSQDALLLGCGALVGALLVSVLRRAGPLPWPRLVTLIGVLTLMAMARPPYAALSLLLLALPEMKWRWRVLSMAVVLGGVAGWLTLMAATGWANQSYYAGIDPFAQAAWLASNPLAVPRIAAATLTQYGEEYLVEFVGKLGWLDTGLPWEYHAAARVMLGLAAIVAMLGLTGARVGAGARLAVALGVLAAAGGVFGILYVTNTPLKDAVVEGVQGRYFLPIALAGAALLPAVGHRRWASHSHRLLLVVAAFPAVSIAMVMHAVVRRYYLG
jgi:uncharacterized membrane protein